MNTEICGGWRLGLGILLVGWMTSHALANNLGEIEPKLQTADAAWLAGDAGKAAQQYEVLLKALPGEASPFRATLIMRLAQARATAADKQGCLEALSLLDAMAYVPEHHALAARELKEVMAGKPHPGLQRTPVPPIGKVRMTLSVGPDASYPSLHEAVAAARAARKTPGAGAIEIVLAPGTYRMDRPVRLTAEDAGSVDSPLVIRSQDPARPAVLTGGVTLSKWTPVEDPALLERLPESARGKALVCDLAAHGVAAMGELVFGGFSSLRAAGSHSRFSTFPVPELFYRGEPQTMARWPDDRLTLLPVNTAPKDELDRYRRWAGEKDLWLYGYWGRDWADAYEKVASVEDDGTIRLVPPTNRYGFGHRQGCAVNALCELDQPGEWYLDVAGNRVVYLPPAGFEPTQSVLSSYGTVIEAAGCAHLQLRDLAINFVRGDALIFNDCSDLLVTGVDIQDCSGLGLRISGGKRHLVNACRIESMGRGGIDLQAGDWKQLDPAHSIVENCRISHLSRIDRTYTPALLLEGMGFKIRHNAFTDIPSSAIRLESCDALVELNYFRRCVYESGDQGAIDMWANPLYRGNIIRWNDFDRIINQQAHLGAAAVRCDDFISGFMIAQNVMRKGAEKKPYGAVQFNKGTDNYVEGNLIIDWDKAVSGRSAGGSQWSQRITGHEHSKRMLEEAPWQSEAWRKKYPMVRDLMNGDDNHNYLVGNLQLGAGGWGGVGRAISLTNRRGSTDVHGETLQELEAHTVPWYPIPLKVIGPYAE